MSLRLWITLLWVATIGVVVGCSGSKPVEPVAPAAAPAAPVSGTPPVAAPPAAAVAPAVAPVATAVDPSKPETKWIGNIPFDVFYDQPLVVASDATPVGGGAGPAPSPASGTGDLAMNKPAETPGTPTPVEGTPAPAPAAGGKIDWAKLLPVDLAVEVSKVARTEINANLQTVQKYNAGMETIRTQAALLGMMAIIIGEHSEKSNLKEKAKFVRDLTYSIQGKASEKGKAGFDATQELFEQVTTILDGGQPPSTESADSVPYVEVADRSEMMKIIDKTINDLKSNIGDPKRMKEQVESVNRQLTIMAALGTMMLDSSYEYADNPEYVGYTNAFIEGAKASLDAAKADNFDGFQGGINKMNTSCGDCHPKFRGGE